MYLHCIVESHYNKISFTLKIGRQAFVKIKESPRLLIIPLILRFFTWIPYIAGHFYMKSIKIRTNQKIRTFLELFKIRTSEFYVPTISRFNIQGMYIRKVTFLQTGRAVAGSDPGSWCKHWKYSGLDHSCDW